MQTPKGCIYATGDLARRHDDGTIELLGRTDFQVKMSGYRIELAEIEAAIGQHPQVKQTVVTQHKESNGVTRLVAYLATGFGPADSRARILMEELPALLHQKLPEYMVPSLFVVMERMPHNSNGKIDRNALPEPNSDLHAGKRARKKPFTPASTPTQKLLARIWAEVLELSAVSITDSIFELGADSLLIFRIAARAQREGLAVNAAQIFQSRTIAGICEAVEEQKTKSPLRVTTRIAPASRDAFRMTKEKVDA